jgi:ATP-grasp domain
LVAPTVLLTLGRLPKGLDVARSFARAGWRVVVAEPFAWHLSRVSGAVAKSWRVTAPNSDRQRYLDDIARIVAAEGVELVVPVSEEAMHVAGVKRALPPGVRFYGMDQQVLLAVHDKLNFALQAAAYDLPVPLSFRGDEPGAATLAAAQSVVVKPRFSCSGLGVTILQPGAILAGRGRTAACLVQAFVSGEVCSTFSLAHEGRVQTTVVYRGTVMSGTVAVAFERIDAPMVATWVETFVRRSGWSGSIAFDVVVDAAGRVHGIECNPRMTSGVHFLHPDDLAPAIVDPTRPIRFRERRLMQQFFPCLTETQGSLFRRQGFRRNLGFLLASRDVTWSWRDPLPLLSMPLTSYQILAKTIFKGQSMGEAATKDIAWFGPPPAHT